MAASAIIKFNNSVSYNTVKVDSELGEKFGIELVGQTDPVDWYVKANNVIAIKYQGNNAQVEAVGIGATTIRIFNGAEQKVLEIAVEILESIPDQDQDPATDLGLKVGAPELKERPKK